MKRRKFYILSVSYTHLAEIRTDKFKSAATDTATALASSVGSLFGSGKMKSLERSKEWSRQEQIQYTADYIKKTFVDKGMCADWSIHDKGDGNPSNA